MEILPENILKLKAAYRHPFEYINPRLYQKKKSSGAADDNERQNVMDMSVERTRFFIDNEEEYQAL